MNDELRLIRKQLEVRNRLEIIRLLADKRTVISPSVFETLKKEADAIGLTISYD